jgi:hypothetical protein
MSEATKEELHRQIRAYEATVHNMQLKLDEAIAERDALRMDLEAVGAGGVQSLCADAFDIAQLRHLYANLNGGGVRDTASAKRIADGLLAPLIERLERAAERAQAAPQPAVAAGWQPIETAPKDGTMILLCTPGGKAAGGAFHARYKVWSWPYVMAEPTHWQPLPPAPITGESNG